MTFKETMDLIALFILPVLIVGLPIYGLIRRVPVYEKFVEGAKDGFTTSVRIKGFYSPKKVFKLRLSRARRTQISR